MSDEAQTGAQPSAPAPDPVPIDQGQNATGAEAPAKVENPSGEATASEHAGAEAAAKPDAAKPKGVQKRIDELVRDREDAKRERDYWRELAMEKNTSKPKAQQESTAPQGEPRQDDFANYEQYLDARADWRAEQRIAQAREAETRTRQQEQMQEHRKAFEADMKAAEGRYPNYREVSDLVLSDPDFPISAPMAEAIMHAEKRADLVYWLGNNPDEARRISRLAPLAAAAALGRVEATLTTPAKRTVTQAPPPPSTLRGGDLPSKNPAEMSMAEYAKWRASGGGTRAA